MIHKPHVDWFALAPSLSLLAAAGLLLMVAVFVPRRPRGATAAVVAFAGFVAGFVWAVVLDAKSPGVTTLVHDAMFRDRWSATAQVILAGCGAVAVLLSVRERWREEHVAEYYALLTAAGAGMLFFVQAANLMTLFLGLDLGSLLMPNGSTPIAFGFQAGGLSFGETVSVDGIYVDPCRSR